MTMMTECRACRSKRLHMFLPMGDHPPANAFLREDQLAGEEAKFSLDSIACLDCGLIQVADQIPPDFFRHYLYIPSASNTMHGHFRDFAETVKERLGPRDTPPMVVDIGCNDGLFLQSCKAVGLRPLGIDPAENIAEMARAKEIEVVNHYFSPEVADSTREKYGPADVITSTNTFNHIGDLHHFTEGVVRLLGDHGIFVLEVPDAVDLVEKNEFDTIYQEHLSEFSVKSLVDLFAGFSLELFDIQRLEIHGGSMRVFSRRKDDNQWPVQPAVARWLEREQAAGLYEQATYDALAERVEKNRVELVALLKKLKAEGKRIAGYGAPAKGNTTLNYFGIGPDLLEYLADRNELKQGLYSPGMRIPVVSPDVIKENPPDYLLILAWNFGDEIMEQQAAFKEAGGKFILPIPDVQVIG